MDPISSALTIYDFGVLFLAIRERARWSQQTFGGIVDLDQSQISAIERGERHLREVVIVSRLARIFGIPPALLNFPNIGATVGQARADRKLVSWVDRRNFGQHIAALTLGVAGAAGLDLDLDRLLALLPQAEPTGTRQVGAADVEVIERFTAGFRREDFAGGSELIRAAAVAYVHEVLPLLGAQIDPDLQPRLVLAVADLATEAGWLSFVVNQHEAARRLWMIGLELARAADHPQSTDLTVYLLGAMTLQAVQLGRPKEAVHLARIGDAAAVGRYPVFQARYLPDLAGARALNGDIDTAVTLGHQAVDLLSVQYSSRVHERLRILNTVLEPLHTSTGVAELRGRLAAIAA